MKTEHEQFYRKLIALCREYGLAISGNCYASLSVIREPDDEQWEEMLRDLKSELDRLEKYK